MQPEILRFKVRFVSFAQHLAQHLAPRSLHLLPSLPSLPHRPSPAISRLAPQSYHYLLSLPTSSYLHQNYSTNLPPHFPPTGLRTPPNPRPGQILQRGHPRTRLRRRTHISNLRDPPSYRQVDRGLLPEICRRVRQEPAEAGARAIRPHTAGGG